MMSHLFHMMGVCTNCVRDVIYIHSEMSVNLFMFKVPIANWLALKLQIGLLPFPWGQHCFLGVAIDNLYSLSPTEERYQAFNLPSEGCL